MRTRYLVSLALVSLPFAVPAKPEWVIVGGNNDEAYQVYLRNDVKRLSDGIVEAWEVWDYKEPQTDTDLKITYRSQVWRQLFNCSDRSAAVVNVTFYSDSMGRGSKLHSIDRSLDKIKYLRGAPGGPGEFMVNKVCMWAK